MRKLYLLTAYNVIDNYDVEKLLNQIKHLKSSLTVVLGEFNAVQKSWWSENIISSEGSQIEILTTIYGLRQLICGPTHVLPNPSSCIDLIFTDQENLVINGVAHPSLHPNCHHQILYCKFNLFVEYPRTYERLACDYGKANHESIKQAHEQACW